VRALKRKLCEGTLLLNLLCAAAVTASTDTDQDLQYRLSWNGIPAASARVRLRESTDELPAVTRVEVQVHTNRFVDLFWSLRGRSSAEVDMQALTTRRFEFDRRINGRPELTQVEIDPDGTLTGRYSRPGRYRLVQVTEVDAVDPITAILRARRRLPATGQPDVFEVFTGEARYRIELHRSREERIEVPAGSFWAVRLSPRIRRLDRSDRDDRVRRVTLWATDAQPHLLLRIRSDVFVGAVYGDLVAISEATPDIGGPLPEP
jgi:hypothetical protein